MSQSVAPAKLETTTCGRCGGSGRHSFNQLHGSRCYGCSGSGHIFTPRGLAASKWLEALRSAPVSQIQVGDLVSHDVVTPHSIGKAFSRVQLIEHKTQDSVVNGIAKKVDVIVLHCTGKTGRIALQHLPADIIRKGFDAATKAVQFHKALAYQDTLDAKGHPYKVAA